MRKLNSEIVVDMSGFKADGDILDIGYKSSGVIYRALKNALKNDEMAVTAENTENDSCSWVYGYPYMLPFEDSKFDAVTCFFSLSLIDKKSEMRKTLSEISRVLKKDGILFLWDLNIKRFNIFFKKHVKVILPKEEEAEIEIKQPVLKGIFCLNTIVPFVERNFAIIKKYEQGEYFYIKAVKKQIQRDDKIENTAYCI